MKGKTHGINHIEFWVSNLARSVAFYSPIFEALGWRKMNDTEFSSGSTIFYFTEKPVSRADSAGARHICFQADSRKAVETIAKTLKDHHAKIIRGPVEMPEYSKGYYTVDFRDPDGYVMEVAHTPNMGF
jgi:catechol 2,3-dioxygenase-like lactoylglutathione lyase family enzyme